MKVNKTTLLILRRSKTPPLREGMKAALVFRPWEPRTLARVGSIISCFLFGLFYLIAFAEESITITTYYPSPYGSYNDLYVANSVGIGVSNPGVDLSIRKSSPVFSLTPSTTTGQSVMQWFTKDSDGDGLFDSGDKGWHVTGRGDDWTTAAEQNDLIFWKWDGSAWANILDLDSSGNVGIATASPTAKLHVNGNIKADLTDFPGLGLANVLYNSGTDEIGYDVAELFEANEEVEPGDVLSIDKNGKLKKSSKSYDSKVAGVVSEAPAILFEGSQLQIAPQPFEFKKGNKPPLALAGRVKCKVTTDNGPINAGDLITTSSRPGYGMKATKPGYVLGKALQSFNGNKTNKGSDTILVLINLSWFGQDKNE